MFFIEFIFLFQNIFMEGTMKGRDVKKQDKFFFLNTPISALRFQIIKSSAFG